MSRLPEIFHNQYLESRGMYMAKDVSGYIAPGYFSLLFQHFSHCTICKFYNCLINTIEKALMLTISNAVRKTYFTR